MEEPLDLGDLTVGKKIIAENFANWTSGNKIIDNFIQEKQLKFEGAIYKTGPLNYDINEKEWIKVSYDKVVLRYLYDLQNITDGLINKIESYLGKYFSYGIGISQNPDTKVYILVFNIKYLKRYCVKCGYKHPKKSEKLCFRCKFNLKIDFISRTSGNKKIDEFIQKMQLKINKYNNTMFEWIPYNEFFEIKEVDGKGRFVTAIWKEGLLHFDDNENKLIRKSYEKVCLKYLYNSYDIINELLREVESSSSYEKYNYGISQNPDTKAYILVFNIGYLDLYCDDCGGKYEGKYDKWCKSCQINYFKNNFSNWTSGNEKIDEFIQNKQLKINKYSDTIIEWIPYNELINIKEVDGEGIAIWKKDPLHFNGIKKKVISESYEKVCLKYLHNSQDVTDEFLNEIESYLAIKLIFGISQNPVTKVYNLVLNEKGNFATAMWKDGRLYYSRIRRKYKRILNEKVLLKYLDNSQNINYTFLNKIAYSINESYGISQNPNTKDFIFVLQPRYYCENCGEKYNNKFEVDNKSCASCQTNHENQKINDLIQEMKLSIDHNSNTFNMIFEWIPYDQFSNIEKIGKGGFSTVYSAIWEDGLLIYDGSTWKRKSNTMVALKCLHNSQNFLDEFINEVRAYPNQKIENILKIYGISQNLNTKNYVIVLEYAEGGNFNNYLNRNRENFDWFNGLRVLTNIIEGLNKIHQKQMVHRDFHIGNILFMNDNYYNACISDMGLCRKLMILVI
uniref:Protein kinase domain-containing protein n=1 Tax=Rhizophagus irregularis (strain DAOM 181602 / DAOM 197198 / MUCL 43194) TaxID=747089 RepID=U9U5T0_RHIID